MLILLNTSAVHIILQNSHISLSALRGWATSTLRGSYTKTWSPRTCSMTMAKSSSPTSDSSPYLGFCRLAGNYVQYTSEKEQVFHHEQCRNLSLRQAEIIPTHIVQVSHWFHWISALLIYELWKIILFNTNVIINLPAYLLLSAVVAGPCFHCCSS